MQRVSYPFADSDHRANSFFYGSADFSLSDILWRGRGWTLLPEQKRQKRNVKTTAKFVA